MFMYAQFWLFDKSTEAKTSMSPFEGFELARKGCPECSANTVNVPHRFTSISPKKCVI